MTRVALIDPLAEIAGRPVMFLRDHFGSEAPFYACPYPPLDLASTAAVLRRGGVGVELIAANVLGLSHARVAERLRAEPPDFALVPSAWRSLEEDRRLLRVLRAALPATKLIVSGPNATAEPRLFLDGGAADLVILGEPEEAVLRLALGEARAAIPNLAYLEAGAIALTPRRLPPGYADYPPPARDLLDLDRYWIPFSKRQPCTTMETVRGCSHACGFCPTHLWNLNQVRARPVAAILAEIEELVVKRGMREICVRDDTFTWNRERVLEICAGLVARGHDLTWRCFATVSTVDPVLLREMARAGCVQVCYGFESGDDRVLKRTGKGTTVAQGRDAARWTKEAGMEVGGTFLVGFEGETAETVDASIAFAIGCGLDFVQANPVLPLPGTPFGRRAPGLERALAPAEISAHVRRFHRAFYLRPRYLADRLFSGRALPGLARQARLGLKIASFALLGRGTRAAVEEA